MSGPYAEGPMAEQTAPSGAAYERCPNGDHLREIGVVCRHPDCMEWRGELLRVEPLVPPGPEEDQVSEFDQPPAVPDGPKKTLVLHVTVPGYWADDLNETAAIYAEGGETGEPTAEDRLEVVLNEWMRREVAITVVSIPGEKCLNSDFEIHTVQGEIVGAEQTPAVPDELVALAGPYEKDAEYYLNPYDWHGDPVPDGYIGPWGLGSTCWYYRVTTADRDDLIVAAETPERALRAALAAVLPDVEARVRREYAEEPCPVVAVLYDTERYGQAARLEALAEKVWVGR